MKMKLSTKMMGETLEQHCEIEFNKLRATAFPKAYFEKDNDARHGSKGDYIYLEKDEAGNEIVSIMFEMKNDGYVLVGYGAAAKGNTLLNFGKITLDFIIDDNPLKQNLLTHSHICSQS